MPDFALSLYARRTLPMLPSLRSMPKPDSLHRRFAEALHNSGFAGDISLDFSSRAVQSTDNSIYQRFPQGVLYPAGIEDLVRIAQLSQEPAFRSVSLCPRGGGTGTNGQALSNGLVVDLSRHMNRILEINVAERWARVEAGVVKDQLNAAVKPYGLFFAPDLSTSNRATIGGMINTDASGQGSCRYGKTRDHVLEIDSVFLGGSRWRSRPLEPKELESVCERDDRIGEVHRVAADVERSERALIQEVFPPLNRSLSGYDLAHLRGTDDRFDLNSLLCGSEGTLGFICEAVVNLELLPRFTGLAIIHYRSFVGALRDSRRLMEAEPTAIETIDDKVLELARGDSIWSELEDFFPQQQTKAVNFLEFSAHSEAELSAALNRISLLLRESSEADPLFFTTTRDRNAINRLWTLRKRAVGLLGRTPGNRRPLPFVEDTAVAPERLADFIEEFRAILDARGLQYGMFGHADAGVIHVRPALDLRDSGAAQTVREVSDQVFALTRKYGGLLWGEHGKGLRSEYVPETFGKLYPQLQKIKAAFDPFNQLNPGKIATPGDPYPLTRLDEVATRGKRDRLIPAAVWEDYPDVVHCNGNGVCFNWDPDQSMCPSWKGSRERKYSPKGRATLMKEWLSQLAEQDYSARRNERGQRGGFLSRARAWAGKGQGDFSQEVFDSMDHCLACKSCATGCPVQVDVAAFRSVFFNHYFRRYLRPLRHHLIARLESILPVAARVPRLYNLATQSRPGKFFARSALGLTALPAMETGRDRAGLLARMNVGTARASVLNELSAREKARSVILVEDVFSRYFDPQLLPDVCAFLQTLGYRIWLADSILNGKPLHVLGFLQAFEKTARRTARELEELSASGVPLVGLDPSMTLTFRDEYPKTLGARWTLRVLLLQEWLAGEEEHLRRCSNLFAAGRFRLLLHCSEAALAADSAKQWQTIYGALGCELTVEQSGCCGMAGTFGHEASHAELSERIYRLSWQPKVEADAPTELCATGFSCRSQAERFSERSVPHPVQVLLARRRAAMGAAVTV
ncbi:D-2-hydroxyglutarate dehydrogenase YdiJ [Gilvimarinus sp. F26214L]|uniref:D-2-hydroxyglutarate dehydrogenase YdiJ n=1 Tax=Gilvimarinus sp. DZF01 TaxID=3461371 RepID=UPI004046278C